MRPISASTSWTDSKVPTCTNAKCVGNDAQALTRPYALRYIHGAPARLSRPGVGEDPVPAQHPDDEFHPPSNGDPYWTETCWFTFTVPERRLSGQLYPFFRANQGVLASGAYFWDE